MIIDQGFENIHQNLWFKALVFRRAERAIFKARKIRTAIDKVQKIILSVCRALEFSPAQANQALTERLVRELAPV